MKRFLPILVIFFVWLAIVVTNFSPQTWLTGWDNLHPEFNFGMNIQRSVWAVWQEYQGLGLLGGMGHAADLPRQLFLAGLSLFFPANWLRQIYFFLMLLIGPLGVYFLTKRNTAASLFYLLNLATIQTFYAPFEAFATHYGFLPWLIFISLHLVKEFNKKKLIWFVVINFLAIPQAYIPTIFVVYLLTLILATRNLKIIILTFIVSTFWLLPFGYFVLNNVRVPMEAKANQMATQEDFLRNKEFGKLADVVLLRGFWFNNKDTSTNSFIMDPWRQHFQSPLVWGAGFLIFGIVLFGLFKSFKEKHLYKWLFLALFLLAFTLIANDTPPFSWIDNLLYKIPLIAQIFRFPFTKFSVLLALMFSIYFGLAKPKLFLVLPLLIFFLWPVFQGNLFFKSEKIIIPQEYFETTKFFNNQDVNTRIANFPQHTFWGWNFYNWGYQGSGFLWYGIQQPILDRAFDVWSKEDENYYKEISYALYSKNLPLFERVLEKYRVNWLLVDGNIINPSSPKALYLDELKDLVKNSRQIRLIRQTGQIGIYEFNLKTPTKSFVSITKKSPNGDFQESANSSFRSGSTPDGSIAENFQLSSRTWTNNPNPEPFAAHVNTSIANSIEIKPPYFLPNLSHDQGYLITVTGKNIPGKLSLFWIENLNSRRADLEERLKDGINYFVQPPMEPDGLGYSLHIENFETEKVTMATIEDPIGRFAPSRMTTGQNDSGFIVEHPNPAFYRVDMNLDFASANGRYSLILAQSFDNGWWALGIDNNKKIIKLNNHVLIDNWANGWEVDPGLRIVYLFYWPQLLEFAGFSLLTIFVFALIIKKRTSSASK